MDEVERLIGELANADEGARVYAANRLGQLNDVRAVDALVGALKDIDIEVRCRAAWALGVIAEENPANAEVLKAVPALVEALKDENSDVRLMAADALGGVGNANPGTFGVVVPELIEALKDTESGVRWLTAGALGNIAEANPANAEVLKAAPALVRTLKDKDPLVRESAAVALGEIGKTNPENAEVVKAVPALVGALKDGNLNVRKRAAEALGKIADGCDTLESLKMLEEKLREGAASLMKTSRSKDEVHDAMITVAELMNKVAAKKNELVRAGMRDLLLSGERPKPPKKDGGMYREIGGMKRAVRHG